MATQVMRKKPQLSDTAKRQERIAYLFLLPSLIIVIAVAFYPLFNTVYVTFFDAKLGSAKAWEYIGLKNYTRLLSDAKWWDAVWNTVKFAVASVTLELVLGLGIALVVNSHFPGRGLMRTAMLVPWA
ncbi:MAG TPA: sugar ABC transporter permease, partial [Caldilineaceae bacterium]|nr:sugar ABC transporter permease [Caldilineaceae bacterium]